ncbi:MAG: glycosyltransferase family 4 protein [Deltaproteobacteria bacterium]|nr:glycosyltransferase family 4 protein [Deltaproteobacteria bacterium]
MRLLYLHQFFATPECAAGTRSYEFGRGLVERGHEVTIITGTMGLEPWLGKDVHRKPQTVMRDGIRVMTVVDQYEQSPSVFKRLSGFGRFVSGAIRRGRKAGPFDAVLATSPPLPIAVAGMTLSRLHRVPLVFEIRDLWPESLVEFGGISETHPGILAGKVLEKAAYRAADRIIATTPGAKRRLVKRGVDPASVDVVVLGSDPDLFDPGCSDGSFRREHGLEDKFVAMFPGAHGLANGLHKVIDAAKVLQDRGSNVHIVLIGRGQLKPQLQEQARKLGLNNVLFHDSVPKTDLVKIVDETDVGLATLKECRILDSILSNKLFDFMAAGKPVVANLPGDMKEILEGKGAGRYAPDMSPEGFADTLMELAALPKAELEAMGARGRALAAGEYARKNLVDDFERTLLTAVAQRS